MDELAATFGWDDDTLICAILVSADSTARIRRESDCPIAYFAREHDVVLIHPLAKGELATTLRPRLSDHQCIVGPAGPLDELRASLDLAQRAANLALGGPGTTFVDDVLFELACCADPAIVRALRRKHLGHLEEESDDRWVLLETLHEWLLQWGHRPDTATALTVHPQTISGRINRIKDLLADDLVDPMRVRSCSSCSPRSLRSRHAGPILPR